MKRIVGAYGEDVLERRLTYADCRRMNCWFHVPKDLLMRYGMACNNGNNKNYTLFHVGTGFAGAYGENVRGHGLTYAGSKKSLSATSHKVKMELHVGSFGHCIQLFHEIQITFMLDNCNSSDSSCSCSVLVLAGVLVLNHDGADDAVGGQVHLLNATSSPGCFSVILVTFVSWEHYDVANDGRLRVSFPQIRSRNQIKDFFGLPSLPPGFGD